MSTDIHGNECWLALYVVILLVAFLVSQRSCCFSEGAEVEHCHNIMVHANPDNFGDNDGVKLCEICLEK